MESSSLMIQWMTTSKTREKAVCMSLIMTCGTENLSAKTLTS